MPGDLLNRANLCAFGASGNPGAYVCCGRCSGWLTKNGAALPLVMETVPLEGRESTLAIGQFNSGSLDYRSALVRKVKLRPEALCC